MITVDALLQIASDNPAHDADVCAEELARKMGVRFVRGAMVAQLVRLEFAPRPSTYRVTASRGLRVRDAPSVITGRKIGSLPLGAIVTFISESGDWIMHDSDIGPGWSVKAFLGKVE